jgi:hypothetical protein
VVLQPAGGVINEHQKRAGRRPIFEPAMVRTVDLDQLADMLTTMARLLDAFALRSGQPDSGLPHPAAQRLSRHAHIMTLAQLLGRQRRAKVRIVLPDQPDGVITHDIRQPVVRWSATPPVRNRSRTAITVSLQQPMGLPPGEPHQIGRRRGRQPTAIEPRQYINAIQLSFAHQHHTHRIRSLQTSRPGGRRLTFQLCSVLTF